MNLIFWKNVGAVSAALMPLFNIPLIMRMVKRQSSEDISLSWVTGVWICILLMAPAGFTSEDIVLKAFNISNLIFFTAVFFVTWHYRKGRTV